VDASSAFNRSAVASREAAVRIAGGDRLTSSSRTVVASRTDPMN
jgi:hypothetical protein